VVLSLCNFRYNRYNIESLDVYRKYASTVPAFLKNRPKKFVEHCINRLPPSVPETPVENIRRNDTDFFVKSPESGVEYRLHFGDVGMPLCSCPDWEKSHWPCKHMLAVVTHYPGQGWDFWPQEYTSSPYFCLDLDVTRDGVPSPQDISSVSNTRVPVSPSQPPTHDTRQECFDLMKSINSGLYGITAGESLVIIHDELTVLDTLVSSHQDRVNGLPVRTSLKTRSHKRGDTRKRQLRPPKTVNVEFDGLFTETHVIHHNEEQGGKQFS
jgi:hypothetical protein